MAGSSEGIEVYLEIGKKRTFAGAVEWPGWCRSGRDEESALRALADYGSRYGGVLRRAGIDFQPPADVSAFAVVERLGGTTTADFGAPDVAPSSDARPVDDAELRRLQTLLTACWEVFDAAVEEARGRDLRKGPRGGGRELDGIVQHVLGAKKGHLAALGWKRGKGGSEDLGEELRRIRQEVLSALAASARGELPGRGPRGGVIWKPRHFVRRAAWHVLDHAWEIEDRVM